MNGGIVPKPGETATAIGFFPAAVWL
jgi:hypothetical protein